MASFNFDNATLRLTYVTGIDEFGKAITSTKTYQKVRDNVDASQVLAVAQALASLSTYDLSNTKMILTETVDL